MGWMIKYGLMLYILFFSLGMSPVPWVYNSEIYPLRVREVCCSISTSANWLSNFVVSMIFPILLDRYKDNDLAEGYIWFAIATPVPIE